MSDQIAALWIIIMLMIIIDRFGETIVLSLIIFTIIKIEWKWLSFLTTDEWNKGLENEDRERNELK